MYTYIHDVHATQSGACLEMFSTYGLKSCLRAVKQIESHVYPNTVYVGTHVFSFLSFQCLHMHELLKVQHA